MKKRVFLPIFVLVALAIQAEEPAPAVQGAAQNFNLDWLTAKIPSIPSIPTVPTFNQVTERAGNLVTEAHKNYFPQFDYGKFTEKFNALSQNEQIALVGLLGAGALYGGYSYYRSHQNTFLKSIDDMLTLLGEIIQNPTAPRDAYTAKIKTISPDQALKGFQETLESLIPAPSQKSDLLTTPLSESIDTLRKINMQGDRVATGDETEKIRAALIPLYVQLLKKRNYYLPDTLPTVLTQISASDYTSSKDFFRPKTDASMAYEDIEYYIDSSSKIPSEQERNKKEFRINRLFGGWFYRTFIMPKEHTVEIDAINKLFIEINKQSEKAAISGKIVDEAKRCRLFIMSYLTEDQKWLLVEDYLTKTNNPFVFEQSTLFHQHLYREKALNPIPANTPAQKGPAMQSQGTQINTMIVAQPERKGGDTTRVVSGARVAATGEASLFSSLILPTDSASASSTPQASLEENPWASTTPAPTPISSTPTPAPATTIQPRSFGTGKEGGLDALAVISIGMQALPAELKYLIPYKDSIAQELPKILNTLGDPSKKSTADAIAALATELGNNNPSLDAIKQACVTIYVPLLKEYVTQDPERLKDVLTSINNKNILTGEGAALNKNDPYVKAYFGIQDYFEGKDKKKRDPNAIKSNLFGWWGNYNKNSRQQFDKLFDETEENQINTLAHACRGEIMKLLKPEDQWAIVDDYVQQAKQPIDRIKLQGTIDKIKGIHDKPAPNPAKPATTVNTASSSTTTPRATARLSSEEVSARRLRQSEQEAPISTPQPAITPALTLPEPAPIQQPTPQAVNTATTPAPRGFFGTLADWIL